MKGLDTSLSSFQYSSEMFLLTLFFSSLSRFLSLCLSLAFSLFSRFLFFCFSCARARTLSLAFSLFAFSVSLAFSLPLLLSLFFLSRFFFLPLSRCLCLCQIQIGSLLAAGYLTQANQVQLNTLSSSSRTLIQPYSIIKTWPL